MADLLDIGLGILGYGSQESTNRANAQLAQNQMDFQERMSNSAYQRQVADLSAAGLNPMLAYIKGGGASTPPGASAVMQNPVATAISAYKAPSELSQIKATTGYTGAQEKKTGVETTQVEAQTELTKAQTAVVNETVAKVKAEVSNLTTDNARIKALTDTLREQKNLYYQQGFTQAALGDMYRATADKLKQEIEYLSSAEFLNKAKTEVEKIEKEIRDLDLQAARKFDNFGREASQLRPVLEVFKALIRPR